MKTCHVAHHSGLDSLGDAQGSVVAQMASFSALPVRSFVRSAHSDSVHQKAAPTAMSAMRGSTARMLPRLRRCKTAKNALRVLHACGIPPSGSSSSIAAGGERRNLQTSYMSVTRSTPTRATAHASAASRHRSALQGSLGRCVPCATKSCTTSTRIRGCVMSAHR